MGHPHLRLIESFPSAFSSPTLSAKNAEKDGPPIIYVWSTIFCLDILVSRPFRKERGKGWATHHSRSISDQFLPAIVGLGLWVDQDAK
jgi:hypothetical protein